jgi:hypothetical protein
MWYKRGHVSDKECVRYSVGLAVINVPDDLIPPTSVRSRTKRPSGRRRTQNRGWDRAQTNREAITVNVG